MEVKTTLDYRPGVVLHERADGKSYMVSDPYADSISSFKDSISSIYPSIVDTIIDSINTRASENEGNYLQYIETLRKENATQNARIELLELQLKFMLNKFAEIEKFMENKK